MYSAVYTQKNSSGRVRPNVHHLTEAVSEEKDNVFIPVEIVLDKLSDWESLSIETGVSKQDRKAKAALSGVLCINRHSV